MVKIRNRSKAYDLNDNLKSEYSVKIGGIQYPLLTAKGGFTSKSTKSGRARHTKITKMDDAGQQEYVDFVRSRLSNKKSAPAPAKKQQSAPKKKGSGRSAEWMAKIRAMRGKNRKNQHLKNQHLKTSS